MTGFQRYYAAMVEAKNLGLIDRMPWGRRPGSLNKKAKPYRDDKILTVAKVIVMTELERLPAASEKPFAEQSMGEQLATNTRLALLKTNEILLMDCKVLTIDPDGKEHASIDKKLLTIQKDTALSMITTQVRVDESVMRRQSADRLPEILRRIKAIDADSVALDNTAPQLIDQASE